MTDPTEFKFDHKGIAVTVKPKAADIARFFHDGAIVCLALEVNGIPRGARQRLQSVGLCEEEELDALNSQLQRERAKHASAQTPAQTPEVENDPAPLGKRVQVLLKSGGSYNGIVQSFDRDGLTLIQEPQPSVTHNAFYFPMSSVDYLVWPVKGES